MIMHPRSQSVNIAQTATFSCSATGYNVRYYWRVESGWLHNSILDKYTNTLVIPVVRSSDNNTYTCVAKTDGGSVSSNGAKLTVTGMTVVRW